jgi:D-aminoacyl-tRNA deacylase
MLIVTSSEDAASMAIRTSLLAKAEWGEVGAFAGHAALEARGMTMVLVDRIHLDEEHIDRRAAQELGRSFEAVVFASRHRAESGIPTLTAHPIGNYSSADYGGSPRTLSPAAPQLMSSALRNLRRNAEDLDFDVSFETTHHGPLVTTPAFYIEIGSDESMWGRMDAADAIAASILDARDDGYPVVLGVGGGHYAPRFTDIAVARKVAIGHMAANYALDALDEEMIGQMASKSGGARKVYFHRKSMSKPVYRALRERFLTCGIEEISSNDLEPIE